jgi:hypothetical protein
MRHWLVAVRLDVLQRVASNGYSVNRSSVINCILVGRWRQEVARKNNEIAFGANASERFGFGGRRLLGRRNSADWAGDEETQSLRPGLLAVAALRPGGGAPLASRC